MKNTYEKYLVSEKREFDKIKLVKRKDAFDKIMKTVKSLKGGGSKKDIELSHKQYDMVVRMFRNFIKVYGYSLTGKISTLIGLFFAKDFNDWVISGPDGKLANAMGKKIREIESLLDDDYEDIK